MPTAIGGAGPDLTNPTQSTRTESAYPISRLARLIRRATSWLSASEGPLGDRRRRAGLAALEATELTRVPRDATITTHGHRPVLEAWDVRGPPKRPPTTATGARRDIGERCRGPPVRGEINNPFHRSNLSHLEIHHECITPPA